MHRRVLALAMVLSVAACGGAVAPPAAPGPSGEPGVSALPAGTHTSAAFGPPATFTVPAGWELASDSSRYLWLRPAGANLVGIHLFRDAAPAAQDPACPNAAAPAVGNTSTELISWIRGLKGLSVSSPALVTVGGLRGASVDIGIAAGWAQSCPFANGLPAVPLLVGFATTPWTIAGGERLRLYVLDLPAGGTILVDLDDFDGSFFDGLLRDAAPIVKSLQFAAG